MRKLLPLSDAALTQFLKEMAGPEDDQPFLEARLSLEVEDELDFEFWVRIIERADIDGKWGIHLQIELADVPLGWPPKEDYRISAETKDPRARSIYEAVYEYAIAIARE